MDRFADIEALVAVVEAGSFSAAGERLGVAKSMVSRRVSQLEQRLGSRLLHRTTRRLALTEAGRHFYQRAVQILADLEDAEQGAAAEVTGLRGALRLAAPLSFGMLHLCDVLTGFLELHPAIELHLDLNDRSVNLVEEGFDLAVRIGDLEDSTLVARRLGSARMVTCASRTYLGRHGAPRHPDELRRHVGLQYTNMSYRRQWEYADSDGRALHAQPQLRMHANNGEVLARAAAAGIGITAGPTFILAGYLRDGRLERILTGFNQPAIGIHALTPPGRLVPRRVQVFIEYLADRIGEQPYWDAGL
ncbi:MAG: LysR family transcriptional regulator [Pseudomonadota bacterium]